MFVRNWQMCMWERKRDLIIACLFQNLRSWTQYLIFYTFSSQHFIILSDVYKDDSEASSVQFSCSVVSDSLQPHELQHPRPPCPSPTPRFHSNSTSIKLVMLSSHLILSSPSPPTLNLSQHQGLFQWVSSSHEVAKVLESYQWTPRTDLL